MNDSLFSKDLLDVFIKNNLMDSDMLRNFFVFRRNLYFKRTGILKRRYLFKKRFKKVCGLFRRINSFRYISKRIYRSNLLRNFFFKSLLLCIKLFILLKTIKLRIFISLIFRNNLIILSKLLSLIKFQKTLVSNIRKFLIRRIA